MRSRTKTWDPADDPMDTAWNDVPCRFNDYHQVTAVACKKRKPFTAYILV